VKTLSLKLIWVLGLVSLLSIVSARADMIMTYAASAGVTTSSVANSTMYTFDSLPTSKIASNVSIAIDSSTTGTINHVDILPADKYGGAADAAHTNGSPYAVQSNSSGKTETTTLTFNQPIDYFGLWWSAGDAGNHLLFYSGTNLLAAMDTAYLTSEISSNTAYFGNPTPGPNHGLDSNEPFAFLNFFDMGAQGITSIVLSNPASSGFESDNWTFRTAAYGSNPFDGPTLPGVLVEDVSGTKIVAKYTSESPPIVVSTPEPSLAIFLGIGTVVCVGYAWRCRVKRNTA